MHGVTMDLSEDFIAKVIGLPKEGIKFIKETNISNTTFKNFLKIDEEEKNLEKNGEFYEIGQIKVIWQDMLLASVSILF